MSDTSNPFAKALGYFSLNDSSDPRVNQALRQKIAIAMMARDRKYPKNLGEGLSAIGDAIGERKMMQSLLQGDLSQQDQAKAAASGLTGASPAAAASPQSYAPPDSLPPAVAAINSAASQGDAAPLAPPEAQPPPPLETAPSQPASMLAPQMPTGIQGVTATPLSQAMNPQPMLPPQARVAPAPAPGPQAGAAPYNMIDAQAGFKRPGPGYIQDAITRNVANPDRQAYLASLVAGEAPHGPADVSSTGADGPFQFTRGTGRQYGLMGPGGDQRRDLDASVLAANKLTDDNAAAFERINGRPPSPADLAVLHQQGGVTGSRMIAGTGNAPAMSLAVNNIPAGSGPAAAVARIKGYYGMPDTPVDARDAIAAQLTARGQGSPPPASPDQRLALAAPQTASDIQSAPPVPSGIRAAPPVQVAQAQPQAVPGYVMPEPGGVQGPKQVGLSPEGQKALAVLNANPNNEYIQKGQIGQTYANEVAKQKLEQDQLNEQYKKELDSQIAMRLERQKQLADQAKRIADVKKTEQDLVSPPASAVLSGADPTLGTSRSPQRTGIPTVPPVPAGTTPQKWAELQAPEMVKANNAYETAAPKFTEAVNLLQQARAHPGREWGVGPGSSIASQIPGTSAYGFKKLMDQIAGQNFLQAYQTLKGGGSITEIEGAKAQEAQARLSTAQNKQDFDKALNDFETTLRGDFERVQRKVNRPVTAWQAAGDNASTAPDVGQRRGNMEYIGGDPSAPASWRRIQ